MARATTHYVVRDAHGAIQHTGRTMRAALAPYHGHLTKREVKGRPGLDPFTTTLRKARLWLFLYRHGWRCTREAVAPVIPTTPD